MPNKGHYVNLAFAASKQASEIHEAQRDVENSLYNPNRLKSVVNFWRRKLANQATNLVRRAKNLNVHSNKFRPDTPEYYTLLKNLALAKARS